MKPHDAEYLTNFEITIDYEWKGAIGKFSNKSTYYLQWHLKKQGLSKKDEDEEARECGDQVSRRNSKPRAKYDGNTRLCYRLNDPNKY